MNWNRTYAFADQNDAAHAPPATLPTVAPQQPATITLQQALACHTTPDSLRAVADWNERKSYDERRRKPRARHKAQAVALRAVADGLERANREEGEWTNPVARAA